MTDAHLSLDGRTLTIQVPMTFKTRGGRKLMISPDGVPSWAKPRTHNEGPGLVARYLALVSVEICKSQSIEEHGFSMIS
jgi:hypothetical protein